MAESISSETAQQGPDADAAVGDVLGELRRLVVTYIKQRTLDPAKGLARYVGFGVGGSLTLVLGLVLLLLGALRVLQTETRTWFTGHLSWVPYAITGLVSLALAGVAATRIGKGRAARP